MKGESLSDTSVSNISFYPFMLWKTVEMSVFVPATEFTHTLQLLQVVPED